ncbi:hypothetical protein P7K49_020213 [Saguinus oedipus]|uniref:Uncharacterized protein n=1 Tax=Saguinus oedipus TaxID=9490 RepID=A0ABQ9V0A4_SAGOE|nr:hypothetical protein P7K49_020213 [Saguinus oedipus]
MQTPSGPLPRGFGDPLHPPGLGLKARRPVVYRLEEVARCLHLLELSGSEGPGCGPGVPAGLQVHRLLCASQGTPGGACASDSVPRPVPRSNRKKTENPTRKGRILSRNGQGSSLLSMPSLSSLKPVPCMILGDPWGTPLAGRAAVVDRTSLVQPHAMTQSFQMERRRTPITEVQQAPLNWASKSEGKK